MTPIIAAMSRLRRLVVSDRWFFVTCRVLPRRGILSLSEFASLAQVIHERREKHHFLLTAGGEKGSGAFLESLATSRGAFQPGRSNKGLLPPFSPPEGGEKGVRYPFFLRGKGCQGKGCRYPFHLISSPTVLTGPEETRFEAGAAEREKALAAWNPKNQGQQGQQQQQTPAPKMGEKGSGRKGVKGEKGSGAFLRPG